MGMSVTYTIDKSQRLIVTVAEGDVQFGDIRDYQNRLVADPDFDPTFDQLIDATRAGSFKLTADQARILASRAIVSRNCRRAFVTTQPHIFGVASMMASYHESLAPSQVFHSMEDALNWLGKGLAVRSAASEPRSPMSGVIRCTIREM
jgi:hypothetical protein